MLSGVYRNRRDFLDSAHGGMAAGALFGVSCKGRRGACLHMWHKLPCSCMLNLLFRRLHAHCVCSHCNPSPAASAPLCPAVHRSVKAQVPLARSVVLGAALGASMGIPIGLLQEKARAKSGVQGVCSHWRAAHRHAAAQQAHSGALLSACKPPIISTSPLLVAADLRHAA